MKKEEGRQIGAPLRREVRKEAYFGCCICGSPIIEYHHIEPFSKVKEHKKDNLIALCPEHHHRADRKEIPKERILKFKETPVNKEKPTVSKDFFLSNYYDMRTRVGSVVYIRTPNIIVVDDFPLITVKPDEDGNALFSATFFDEDENILAKIIDNEWTAYIQKELWDIAYSPGHLKINLAARNIFLELKLLNGNIDLRGDLYYNNQKIRLLPNETRLETAMISGGTVIECGTGIYIQTK